MWRDETYEKDDQWRHTPIWYAIGYQVNTGEAWNYSIDIGTILAEPSFEVMANYSDMPWTLCAECHEHIYWEQHYLCKDCRC